MSDDDLEIELQALEHTYAPDAVKWEKRDDGNLVLTALLSPRGEGHELFVKGTLQLTLLDYPHKLPEMVLLDAKGLGDARQATLMSLLEGEARELLGSMMLVTLIQSATSWLTDNNSPEGTCAFCLEPVTSSSGAAAEEPLTRLPCFHAFHTACFSAWWAWQQGDSAAREHELVQHTGARAAATIISDKLPPREEPPYTHLYSAACPVCRAPSPLNQLPHLVPHLEQALEHAQRPVTITATGGDGGVVSSSSPGGLAAQGVDLKRVRALQQLQQPVWQRQQAANGLISATPADYYSITRPLPPAEQVDPGECGLQAGVAGLGLTDRPQGQGQRGQQGPPGTGHRNRDGGGRSQGAGHRGRGPRTQGPGAGSGTESAALCHGGRNDGDNDNRQHRKPSPQGSGPGRGQGRAPGGAPDRKGGGRPDSAGGRVPGGGAGRGEQRRPGSVSGAPPGAQDLSC